MAIDVFLIVFYKYDNEALHKLEKWYISIITTLVFIPALIFLFIHTEERGPMFASVTVSACFGCQYGNLQNSTDLVFHISAVGNVSHNILLRTYMVGVFTQTSLICNPNQFPGLQYSSP